MSRPASFHLVNWLINQNPPDVGTWGSWGKAIFRDGLPDKLAGTGLCAITVGNSTGGAEPGPGTTIVGQTVTARFYADHTRDAQGISTTEDAADRAWDLFTAIDLLISKTKALVTSPATILCHRVSGALPTFDPDQELPYIAVVYDVTILEQS